MTTNLLILLPLAGALVVWLFPSRNARAVGSLALLVALAEVALWVGVVANFDFGVTGLQNDVEAVWFADLDAAYKVGLYDFSLWLVGLTAVVTAAAAAYGVWVGRDRPRAYFGLILFLAGATVGVFTAQDLLLFYVFWEAML
ncbi:MAG TPA: hypothetical protein VG079_01340, partial [Gaiellaceae bacterium]|nr:hypothetical protein [Gaiellaceae bacterium]